MNVIDHGNWLRYTPTEFPEGVPKAAMFAQRESDGVDWYKHSSGGENFGADTVKFTALWHEGIGYLVGAANYDVTMLFPPGHIVGEITDYTGSNPQADLGGKLYDPDEGAFREAPPPPAPMPTPTESKILTALDSIMDRLEKLERK
jgi:hypothetical protein